MMSRDLDHVTRHTNHMTRDLDQVTRHTYGVATVNRIDKITGLFCKRDP